MSTGGGHGSQRKKLVAAHGASGLWGHAVILSILISGLCVDIWTVDWTCPFLDLGRHTMLTRVGLSQEHDPDYGEGGGTWYQLGLGKVIKAFGVVWTVQWLEAMGDSIGSRIEGRTEGLGRDGRYNGLLDSFQGRQAGCVHDHKVLVVEKWTILVFCIGQVVFLEVEGSQLVGVWGVRYVCFFSD
ncbi:hypothetical protein Tco_1185321 [Tanacetum coccineum]